MTATVQQSRTQDPAPVVHEERRTPGRWNPWWRIHGRAPIWLIPTLLTAGVVQFVNMTGSPQRIDDEGTYTAQAWAVLNLGELAHYTYWYDHPPLGWLQIAGYAQLTGAFERWDLAVMAGREAVLVATVISTGLLWLLCRRTGLGRGASTVAALIFAVSPLAVQFHRTVYLDNIATPWLLGALVLATSRKYQLAGFAGASAAFGVAVLSKETYLLALPLLVWIMISKSSPAIRRYTLSVAASVLVLIGGAYLLFATVKGELLPGEDRVSLYEGITFQLASRETSGSVLDPDSQISRTLALWWQLDPVFITTGVLAGVAGLFIRRLRPYAAMLVFLMIFIFRPGGYLPVPYIIMLLPFAALSIAGIGSWAARNVPGSKRALAGLAALAGAATVAAPLWADQLRGLLNTDLDAPTVQAQNWVGDNVERTDRVIVDDAMWVDLVEAGFDRDNVIWYYKMDTDDEVMDMSPNGWRDSDYIVTTDSMRTFPDQFPQVSEALENSAIIASFGEGTQQVDVRRIYPDGLVSLEEEQGERSSRLSATGTEVSSNPGLAFDARSAEMLRAGQVDARILIVLTQLAGTQSLIVEEFPVVDGEDGTLRRQVLLGAVDGEPLTQGSSEAVELQLWLEALDGPFSAEQVRLTGDGVLATFSIDPSDNLLPARQ